MSIATGQHPQDHTFPGKRGDTVINPGERAAEAPTLRYRDVYEAVLIAINRSVGCPDGTEPFGPTSADLSQADPVSVAQNACVVLEERAGIYPNVPGRAT